MTDREMPAHDRTSTDHDEPYTFGRVPNARAPWPFTERQYARLLILRGKVRAQRESTSVQSN